MDNENDLKQTILDRKREEIAKIMAPIFEDITNYPYPHGVIREEFFTSVFLPYFAGEITENEFPDGISMHTWNQIAGNMNNSVDVIDSNGRILFTVPPVNDLSYIVQNPDTYYDQMSSAGTYAETLRNSARPDEVMMADKVISKKLNERIPVRLKDKKEERYKQWAEIFLRYGYFTEQLQSKEETKVIEQTKEDLLDDCDWE